MVQTQVINLLLNLQEDIVHHGFVPALRISCPIKQEAPKFSPPAMSRRASAVFFSNFLARGMSSKKQLEEEDAPLTNEEVMRHLKQREEFRRSRDVAGKHLTPEQLAERDTTSSIERDAMAASVPTSDAMPGPTVGRRRRSSVHLSDIGGESPTRGVTNARRGSLVHRSTDGDLRRAPGMEGSSSSQESNLECMKTFAFMSERQEGQLAHAPDWRAQRRESLEGGGPVAAAAGNGSPLSLQNSRRNSGVGRELERNDNSSLGYQRRGSVGAGLAAGAGGESFVRGRRGSLIYADASLSPPLRGSPISPERSPESRRNALQGAAGKVIAVGGAVRLLHEGREKGGRLEKKQTFRRMSQDSGDTSREPSASHGPNTEQSPARSESPARSKSPARSESPNRKTRSSKTLRVAGETMVAAGRLARAPKEGMGHLQQDTGNVARTFGGMVGGMAGGNVDFNAKSIDQRRAELHEKVAARRVKGESRGRRGSVDQ